MVGNAVAMARSKGGGDDQVRRGHDGVCKRSSLNLAISVSYVESGSVVASPVLAALSAWRINLMSFIVGLGFIRTIISEVHNT